MISSLHQTHSNKFIYIDKNFTLKSQKFNADAIITDRERLPIAVLNADKFLSCYMIKKKLIAIIHAG